MTGVYQQLENMIESVAVALGEDLRKHMAFVGGCTTGLLVTDDYTRQGIRYTEDVDLIVGLMGRTEWTQLQGQLQAKGFRHVMNEDIVCRMRLGELKVDFMPDDASILGFTNRWYRDALANAQNHELKPGLIIKILTPEYFLATKLEAYLGRGNNDPMFSRDIEDLMNLIHGRTELAEEIKKAQSDVKRYIAGQLSALRNHRDFANIVQSTARGNVEHEELLNYRIDELIKPGV
jgi:predicted nucleotidyltransferase